MAPNAIGVHGIQAKLSLTNHRILLPVLGEFGVPPNAMVRFLPSLPILSQNPAITPALLAHYTVDTSKEPFLVNTVFGPMSSPILFACPGFDAIYPVVFDFR